jgi:hypothetical protein
MADQAIAKKEVLLVYDYGKALMMSDKDISAFHATGWFLGVMPCVTSLVLMTIISPNPSH